MLRGMAGVRGLAQMVGLSAKESKHCVTADHDR